MLEKSKEAGGKWFMRRVKAGGRANRRRRRVVKDVKGRMHDRQIIATAGANVCRMPAPRCVSLGGKWRTPGCFATAVVSYVSTAVGAKNSENKWQYKHRGGRSSWNIALGLSFEVVVVRHQARVGIESRRHSDLVSGVRRLCQRRQLPPDALAMDAPAATQFQFSSSNSFFLESVISEDI